ncbi:MAG TPA: alpha/beta hydrolase [Candidatus Angelobacter sp.]|jgi:pimeloyl-ACP methyl ester carboxylesterase|nr:alpha/beta hydrolase [Candidatus Angelobacter sp.]
MTFVMIAVVVLGLQAIYQAVCSRRDAHNFPPPGELVGTSGCQLHALAMGTGHPAVVLEAGISNSCLNWSLVQPQLAALMATYSYDRAGLGWSAAAGRAPSLRALANDLHATLERLNVAKPYILVAHSFGAYVLLAYIQDFAQGNTESNQIAGVVLVDPLTPEEWAQPTVGQRLRLFRAVWFTRAAGILAALGVSRFLLWLFRIGDREPSRFLRAAAHTTQTGQRILHELIKLPLKVRRLIRVHWSSPKFFWTMANQVRALPRCAQEAAGCVIPPCIPVTVISGVHQPPQILASHAAIANHSSRGKHIVAGKSAHWVQFDEPELIVEAVREIANST